MKKLIWLSVVATNILLIAFAFSIPLVNDYCAEKVVKELESVPLPEKTEHIESVSKAGKLVGCGNGMQFFGVMLVKSDLTLDELDEYYSDYRQSEWEYIEKEYVVKKQIGQEVDIIEHETLSFTKELDNTEDYYIIYSWGDGIALFSWLDLRGQ